MTILVLYAGGTIGMESTPNGYQPMINFEPFLKEQITQSDDKTLPSFEVTSLEKLIDSANLIPEDWTSIGNELVNNWDKYDGFVLLHGTDTMAYTASMLSFMLQGCNKPVIVTGSQIPMIAARNDAINNVVDALMFTQESELSEVCICFNGLLIRGNRTIKVSSADLEAFDSLNYPRLGKAGITLPLNQYALLETNQPYFEVPHFDPAAVAVIYIYPGMQASALESQIRTTSIKGLILCTYGSGNPPAADTHFMSVLKTANDRGICIVNITQCSKGGVAQGTYATGSALGKLGVLSGHDMTLEAAFTKLHFLIGSGLSTESIKHKMALSLCGEYSE